MELRKILWGKRGRLHVPARLPPVLILGLRAFVILRGWTHETAGGGALWYATIYQNFTLRFVVFLGCAWIFTNLFRGEILDRSLHYYFLSPIRRDVLVVAKFVSGVAGSALVFSATTVVSFSSPTRPRLVGRFGAALRPGAGPATWRRTRA